MRNKFTKKISEIIPIDKRAEFYEKFNTLNKNFTIEQFRNEILNFFKLILPVQKEEEEVRIRYIDSALVNSLKGQEQILMHQCCVHIADTNWFQGVHTIHFAVAMNPGSGKIEMWEVYDNGTHFRAIDQKYWLQDKAWEFYCHPEKIFNQNEEFHLT